MQAADLTLNTDKTLFRLWYPGRGSPDPSQGFNSCFSTEVLLKKSIWLNIPSFLGKALPHCKPFHIDLIPALDQRRRLVSIADLIKFPKELGNNLLKVSYQGGHEM